MPGETKAAASEKSREDLTCHSFVNTKTTSSSQKSSPLPVPPKSVVRLWDANGGRRVGSNTTRPTLAERKKGGKEAKPSETNHRTQQQRQPRTKKDTRDFQPNHGTGGLTDTTHGGGGSRQKQHLRNSVSTETLASENPRAQSNQTIHFLINYCPSTSKLLSLSVSPPYFALPTIPFPPAWPSSRRRS